MRRSGGGRERFWLNKGPRWSDPATPSNAEFLEEAAGRSSLPFLQDAIVTDNELAAHEQAASDATGNDTTQSHTHSHDQPRDRPASSRSVVTKRQAARDQSQEKVRSTLRQMVRDWSVDVCAVAARVPSRLRLRIVPGECRASANAKHAMLLAYRRWRSTMRGAPKMNGAPAHETARPLCLTHRLLCRTTLKVLVPGAGLGRLPLEIASKGASARVADTSKPNGLKAAQASLAKGTSLAPTC